MAWIVEDRRVADYEKREEPYLTEALKKHLTEKYIPRYPTKRAVLLPALHLVQHTYNWIPTQALEEVAAFLEISPAEALDTASFYEEYWLKPKGKYLVGVCRSLACEICGSRDITDRLKQKLGIEVGETTADGRFTLIEMECLGSCGTAPVALVNEVLAEEIDPRKLEEVLDRLPADPHDYKDPTIDWEEKGGH
ncbi:MAG: NADH-quinone oxidoreductase subunit NuoE [Phycisphaerales bacterium]|jgi:NADH-quinone oxidoreductase subunit E|nr:NADH-quinone oxidoreductase subunit NuoE [Phycisphaerales bacterium]